MKKIIILLLLSIVTNAVSAQNLFGKEKKKAASKTENAKEITWMSFEDAVKLGKKHPRKILIDVYTSWCGWCKRMDASTYKDSSIIAYINKNYYAVRLDAETKDSINFEGRIFHFRPEYKCNELALSLLNSKMSYPTTVYLDEHFNMLSPVAGYINVATMNNIIRYYGENSYKTTTWEKFQKDMEDNKKADNTKK